MSAPEKPSLYDKNDYYSADLSASRLSSVFNGLLRSLDRLRAAVILNTITRRPHLQSLQTSAAKPQGLQPLTAKKLALDVGAGNGSFLYYLGKQGYATFGTTASGRGQAAAKKVFDVDLQHCTALSPEITQRQYDLVVYWHVFEHLEEPASHFSKWKELLKDGGWIVIEVPNISSIGAGICYESWLGSDDVHHVNHQTPEKILATLSEIGLQPRCVQGFSIKFTYVFLWSALLGRIFGRFYSFDRIMDLLKSPGAWLRQHPLGALNAFAALVYLAPVILTLTIVGIAKNKGEIFRVYAQKVAE